MSHAAQYDRDRRMDGEGGRMNYAGTFHKCHCLAVNRNSFCQCTVHIPMPTCW